MADTRKQLLTRILPQPCESLPLVSAYLEEDNHIRPKAETPWIYANMSSTLDGRIAIKHNNCPTSDWHTPPVLRTIQDWSLFQQLQAQAYCLVTHSGYLRQLSDEKLGDILSIHNNRGMRNDDTQPDDLINWRIDHGLKPQPDVLVLSRTLDFTIPHAMLESPTRFSVICNKNAPDERIKALLELGVELRIQEHQHSITAQSVKTFLIEKGHLNAYLQTGPLTLHDMIESGVLNRLYLTLGITILAGEQALSLATGSVISKNVRWVISQLSMTDDPSGPCSKARDTEQQLFLRMEPDLN